MPTVKIKGMSCNHCAVAVTKALNEIDGLRDVTVDLSSAQATYVEEKPVDISVIEEKIKQAGYEVV